MELSFRDLGGAGRPPLVLLHGLLGSSRNWQSAGAELAAHHHVLALDLRNHGASPHAPTMSYSEMMDDVLGWLDGQGLDRVDLLGHSMGGKVAMVLACRHPQRINRLAIVDIAPKDYAWAGHRASFAAMNELNLAELRSRAEAEMRFEARVPNWAMRKFLTTNLERTNEGGWRWMINLPAISAALADLERNSLQPGDRFEGPVLFVAGAKSDYIETTDAAVIRRHFPVAKLVSIESAGHNPHMDTRQEFVRVIEAEWA